MNDQLAIVCVAFGDQRYIEQQVRLKESTRQFYPEAALFFWTNELPPGARSFEESLYGFKPHAVQAARQAGHTQILFLDPACFFVARIDALREIALRTGVVAAQDDNKLERFVAPRCLATVGVAPEIAKEIHLVGGSLYYFNFESPLCEAIFADWMRMELEGLFHCPEAGYHRNDETCMALAMYRHGSGPVDCFTAMYNSGNGVDKKHFK